MLNFSNLVYMEKGPENVISRCRHSLFSSTLTEKLHYKFFDFENEKQINKQYIQCCPISGFLGEWYVRRPYSLLVKIEWRFPRNFTMRVI